MHVPLLKAWAISLLREYVKTQWSKTDFETIRNAAATDIIISGCDGEPLPINPFGQNLAMLKVQYRGLDLMRVHASRTQTCAHPMLDVETYNSHRLIPHGLEIKVLENIRDTIKEHLPN